MFQIITLTPHALGGLSQRDSLAHVIKSTLSGRRGCDFRLESDETSHDLWTNCIHDAVLSRASVSSLFLSHGDKRLKVP